MAQSKTNLLVYGLTFLIGSQACFAAESFKRSFDFVGNIPQLKWKDLSASSAAGAVTGTTAAGVAYAGYPVPAVTTSATAAYWIAYTLYQEFPREQVELYLADAHEFLTLGTAGSLLEELYQEAEKQALSMTREQLANAIVTLCS